MIYLIMFIYAILAEYVVHRYFMHRKTLGGMFSWIYIDHALEHHGKKRNDINIEMPFMTVFVISLPLNIFVLFFGIKYSLIVILLSFLYSVVWTNLHKAHHNMGYNFIPKIPFYGLWKNYHLTHHNYPNKNYGTVFIYSDLLFGSYQWQK